MKSYLPVEFSSPGDWKKGVTIYAKALAIFAVSVLLLFGALYGLTEGVILSRFQDTEKEQVLGELGRIHLLLQQDLNNLGTTVADWSYWNDMYSYVGGKNVGFAETNLVADVVETLGVDFMGVWGSDGKRLAFLTRRNGKVVFGGDAEELENEFRSVGLLERREQPNAVKKGYLLLKGTVFMVAGGGVLPTNRKGEAAGYVVFGKVLAGRSVQDIFPLPDSSFRVLPLAETAQFGSVKEKMPGLLEKRADQVYAQGENSVVGLSLLNGLNDKPLAVLLLQQRRTFYDAGVKAVRIFLLAMTAAGGGLVLILWFVIDWNLLRRIGRIDRGVRKLQKGGEAPEELQFSSHDELGRLARSIVSLNGSLREAEASYRRIFETSSDGTAVLDYPGLRILETNPSFCSQIKREQKELHGEVLEKVLAEFPSGRLREAFNEGHPFRLGEFVLGEKTGEEYWAEIVGVKFESPAGPRVQLSFRDITERKESEEKMRELSARLLSLQDDERRRIARELHDSTAQNLSALEMNFTLLEKLAPQEPGKLRDILAQSRNIADLTSREIRTIAYLLHPPLLDEVGLPFAIRWFVEGFATRTGIEVELSLPEEFPRFAEDLETALFRIVQESLTNIYRHSGSRKAEVLLGCEAGFISLKIKDYGRGFSVGGGLPKEKGFGLGLPGMRERVHLYHGEFLLDSSKAGTHIQIKLPCGNETLE